MLGGLHFAHTSPLSAPTGLSGVPAAGQPTTYQAVPYPDSLRPRLAAAAARDAGVVGWPVPRESAHFSPNAFTSTAVWFFGRINSDV